MFLLKLPLVNRSSLLASVKPNSVSLECYRTDDMKSNDAPRPATSIPREFIQTKYPVERFIQVQVFQASKRNVLTAGWNTLFRVR